MRGLLDDVPACFRRGREEARPRGAEAQAERPRSRSPPAPGAPSSSGPAAAPAIPEQDPAEEHPNAATAAEA
eukprot:9283194-Pyramimonas_sp.AAC.1